MSTPRQTHDRYALAVLAELESDGSQSQRTLANRLGIALGLTNLLLRRFVHKGWVRAVQIRPNRVGYLVTPAGIREKAVRSTQAFQEKVRFYAEVKARVRRSIELLIESDTSIRSDRIGDLRLVFVGVGEVAEIAYICLHGIGVQLVGVVDERPVSSTFFGLPVHDWAALSAGEIREQPFDYAVVTVLDGRDEISARLRAAGIDSARVVWL